ncbi:hypothetical protein AG1IA_03713 [Rhizoctonia solani AG-1 IA]|uniref:Uncharacterized protein n=1 Tax=Thanatephorus cucumeris (strain AG1-IA) TaxID=983506 RepID=L8WWA7_THACA|nr:hypothetical protein AG1IA_03713 [Rhizoctonia solani AG-1 IA]
MNKSGRNFGCINSALAYNVFDGNAADLKIWFLEERLPNGWEPKNRSYHGLTIKKLNGIASQIEKGISRAGNLEAKVKKDGSGKYMHQFSAEGNGNLCVASALKAVALVSLLLGLRKLMEEFFNDEKGYYLDALVGVHQSLSFMGKPPLFILKDEWETTPPVERAFCSIDREKIKIQPVALVQWKAPHVEPELKFVEGAQGEKECELGHMGKMIVTHLDVIGFGEEEEEELDVVSSDDEEGMRLKKGKVKEDKSLTVYYPLIPLPSDSRDRGKEIREDLKEISQAGRWVNVGAFCIDLTDVTI